MNYVETIDSNVSLLSKAYRVFSVIQDITIYNTITYSQAGSIKGCLTTDEIFILKEVLANTGNTIQNFMDFLYRLFKSL